MAPVAKAAIAPPSAPLTLKEKIEALQIHPSVKSVLHEMAEGMEALAAGVEHAHDVLTEHLTQPEPKVIPPQAEQKPAAQ